MHSTKAASILILLMLIASPTLALSHKAKAQTDNESPAQGEASESPASAPKAPANKGKSQRFKHSPARRSSTDDLSLSAVSLVSGAPEYLSGEAISAFVSGVDFNGDGTTSDLLPGTRVNCFNRGRGRDDLAQLVDSYNQAVAGKQTLGGQQAPNVTLPADYSFGDSFFSQDLRLSHTVPLGRERVRLVLIGEVINLLNIANLVGYSGNIANTAEFGQPAARFSQVFGSGGPRAFQLGARVSF